MKWEISISDDQTRAIPMIWILYATVDRGVGFAPWRRNRSRAPKEDVDALLGLQQRLLLVVIGYSYAASTSARR